MKLVKWIGLLGIAIALSIGAVACKKSGGGNSGVSVAQYNELIEKHNALVEENAELTLDKQDLAEDKDDLVNGAWKSSNEFLSYIKATQAMNLSLKDFSENVLIYLDMSDSGKEDSNNYKVLKEQFEAGNKHILNAQNILIAQYNELYKISPDIYKRGKDVFNDLRLNQKKGQLISGIDAQHQALWDIVNNEYSSAGGQPQKEIKLTKEEKVVSQTQQGGGFTIDNSGNTFSMNSTEFRNYAIQQGYDSRTVGDSQAMAQSMNGVVGMACTNKNLVEVMNRLVSHMKAKANSNTDDLEIAIAIDYSRSMSNNIKVALNELQTFVGGLSNVKNAGRDVRVGISTFGNKGYEKINLDLTNDLSQVQGTLASLLSQFNSKHHSMDPGEASYYGLLKTADMSWASLNRQTIVITDEPAYSLQVKDTAFVNNVVATMKDNNVYPLMVKLCN